MSSMALARASWCSRLSSSAARVSPAASVRTSRQAINISSRYLSSRRKDRLQVLQDVSPYDIVRVLFHLGPLLHDLQERHPDLVGREQAQEEVADPGGTAQEVG